jgi:hypothetical protein
VARFRLLILILGFLSALPLTLLARVESANGKFILNLGPGSTRPAPWLLAPERRMPISASAIVMDSKGLLLWRRSIQCPFPEWAVPDQAVLADDAKYFAVLPAVTGGPWCLVYGETGDYLRLECPSRGALENLRFDAESIRGEFDTLKDERIFRVWDCDVDRWAALFVDTGEPIKVTPALAAEWNKKTAEKIRAHIYAHDSMNSQRALEKWLPRVKVTATAKNVPDISDLEYEFLAARRDFSDRPLFDALWNKTNSWRPPPARFARLFWEGPSGMFSLGSSRYQRARADHFLAIWENKIPSSPLRSDQLLRHNHFIGAIRGDIHLAAPLTANPGELKLYLIPASLKNKFWESREETEKVAMRLPSVNEFQDDLIDHIAFSFETARAGDYFLKAIWDRRAPFDSARQAGIGDYETALVGPIQLAGGGVITNILLNCTNRSSEGAAYYAADEILRKRWRAGKLNVEQFLPYDFTRPLADWIIETNLSPRADIGIRRITVLKGRGQNDTVAFRMSGYYKPPLDTQQPVLSSIALEIGFGHLLVKQIPILSGRLTSSSPFGSVMPRPTPSAFSDGSFSITFNSVPRSNQVFHLLGFAANRDGRDHALFDFTLTNLFLNATLDSSTQAAALPPDAGLIY